MKDKYFSHDANARTDPKIIRMRKKYGMEGYGVYFALLEMMYGEAEQSLPMTDEQMDAIAYELHSEMDMSTFVSDCIEIGLFETDEKTFWSASFRRRIAEIEAKAARRTQTAKNAAVARWSERRDKCTSENQKRLQGGLRASEAAVCVNEPEYERFAKAYIENMGDMPTGKNLQLLNSYYDDMGADVLIMAVEQANLAGAAIGAHPFVLKILNEWQNAGVDSVEKAEIEIIKHAKKKNGRKPQEQPKEPDENIKWV